MSAAPPFDPEQDQRDIRHRLEGLDRRAVVAFAARCAWRAAPLIVRDGHEWLQEQLANVQVALVVAMLRAHGGDRIPNAAAAAAAANIPERTSNAAFAAAFAASAAAEVEDQVANAANAAANTAALAAKGLRHFFRDAHDADLDALQGEWSYERLLQQPLWQTSPDFLDGLWKQWQDMTSRVPAAGEFFELMQRIHQGEPDWERLRQMFENWWSQHPKNLDGESQMSSETESKPARAKTAKKPKPLEPRTRRIIQSRLVSTTSVAADGEAEKLTPTARNCMLALREFLVSDETLTPLTVAVEAPWGGGKSSLMRHLQDALTNDSDATTKQRPFKEEPIPTVWFNPWKHEAGKTLWAAFAVAFERQLAGRLIWPLRLCVRWRLAFRRLTFGDWFMLVARLLVWLGVGWVLYWLWEHPDLVKPSGDKDAPKADVVTLLLQGAPWIGFPLLLWQLISTLNKEFGSPLKLDVSRLLTQSDHEEQVDDLHRFHEDFRRLMRAYIPKRKNGKPGKAVVFIDDLDRCEAPKAAELLQSLHQMLNVHERSRNADDKDMPGVICVLGMDREKVAAAVAAKHEKLLPLLVDTGANGKVSRANAMIFGHEFLEKFIQLTLHLPAMLGNDLNEYLQSITGAKQVTQTNKTDSKTEQPPPSAATSTPATAPPPPATSDAKLHELREGLERKETQERIDFVNEDLRDGSLALQCAQYVAAALENNPRKLKQFVNLFRLRLYLAAAMNFLDLPDRDDGKLEEEPLRPASANKLSPHHLAKLVALELAAPSEMTDIREKPSSKLFDALLFAFPADTKPALNALVSYRDPVQPEAYDLEKAPLEVYFHYFKPEAQATSAVAA